MTDILVIGSGPAGLSAALYAARAGLEVKILEKVLYGTGQISDSSRVDNYLGLAGTGGYDLGQKFRKDVSDLNVEFITGEAVSFVREDNIFTTTLRDGSVLMSRTVIYAAGAYHRHLGISSEADHVGRGVSFCAVCDGMFFKKKPVAVVGGGDTALDDAAYLSRIASKVYLIHRRDFFRGNPATLEKLRASENVEFIVPANIKTINGAEKTESVTLDNGKTIDVNGVFVAIGMVPATDPVRGFAAADDHGYIISGEDGITDVPGFFTAGDCRTKKLRQVSTAVADGANAFYSAQTYLRDLSTS